MKADLSRLTFDPARRYRAVRMQQGRVQMDADWNEQQDILNRRIETETADTVGPVGVPLEAPGFALAPAGKDLSLSAGRLYVDGLLCENPQPATVARQPDLPPTASPVLPAGASALPLPPPALTPADIDGVVVFGSTGQAAPPPEGMYLAYLEAWQRHLCTLDLAPGDASMREVALGGPDTATREKTVWQVKLMQVGAPDAALTCLSALPPWDALTTPPDARMAARAEASVPPKTPCQLPPDAGYRLLENHLYRIEIHQDGAGAGKARYKWSRENGSILSRVVRWLDDPVANEFEVASIGRDDVLAITAGCWVEFLDDTHELLGQPGPLAQVVRTDGNTVTIDPATLTGHPLDAPRFPANPRVRRWDGVAEITPAPVNSPNAGWVELEQDGVEIKFSPGRLRVGDYWLIPARTATASIEWPQAPDGKPAFSAPAGVLRAFARLALLRWQGGAWSTVSDCRPLFPALTDLTQLYYAGGDGQGVKPNPAMTPDVVALPSELRAGVANGSHPVANAIVRFTVDAGRLPNGTATQDVPTGADGVAAISWSLACDPARPVQRATAQLLVAGQPAPDRYLPLRYTATLALASEVAYDPSGCADLLAEQAYTVQQALDALCKRTHGGGCCLTIGPAGDFPTLDRALRTLIGQDRLDICLCLTPGEHKLEDDLVIKGPRVRLMLHGCGPASRLMLGERKFSLNSFAAVSVADLTISRQGQPEPIDFSSCVELRLSRVDCAGPAGPGASLVRIEGSRRVHIDGCRLVAAGRGTPQRLDSLFSRAPTMAVLKAALSPQSLLDDDRDKAALALARQPMEARKAMAAEITALLRAGTAGNALSMNPRIQAAMTALVTHLGQESPTAKRLHVAISALAAALLADPLSCALALLDNDADTTVRDNRLHGGITLFSESGEFPELTLDQLKLLGAGIRTGKMVPEGDGTLTLQCNQLSSIRLGAEAARAMLTIIQTGGEFPAWRRLHVADNALEAYSHFPALDAALTGNRLPVNGDTGALITTQAKIIGNFAHNDFRLFVSGANLESLANGGLNVVTV
ncbi:DUF6519 domain-containing protein [Achromobacter arsenitoxydans]|uniref:Uncharacterized protein n=1 Tax=Achromobacter arsenitoxydans SY8 TaxID=477184 RepID=H0FAR4_9BURK|nr:DUF6519 domain-containing protein [Achromobacter arsenitoxydans]EHK64582.1 hypothetical protein KYC_19354 [Achromobacter arsenitoxydans SY8]